MPNPKPAHPVVSIQYWLVTDRRTGGQTDTPTLYDSICRTSIASRGKKSRLKVGFYKVGENRRQTDTTDYITFLTNAVENSQLR